jgi:hypothetical protein
VVVVVDDGPAAARIPAGAGGGEKKANGENGAARDINNVKIRTRSDLRGNSIIITIIIIGCSSFFDVMGAVCRCRSTTKEEVFRGGWESAGID